MSDKDNILLPYVSLGKTGLEVSRLGLGGFHQVEISIDIIEQVISAYFDVGGNYIETARIYGNGASEEKLGRVLESKRNDIILASKSISRDADGIRNDLETSLKLLKTDYLDFYFIHSLLSLEEIDIITGPEGALSALIKAKEEGLIGGIGMSSHRPPDLYIEAIKRLPLSVILIWDNLLEELYLPEIQEEVYPLAREHGVGITAMKPLADGFFYRSVENALRYVLGSGSEILICGVNSPDHVYQAAEAIREGPATPEERQKILKDTPELGQYVCRQCGECSEKLMTLFKLEGYIDRQMIDYLPHDPADYALRLRLSGWYHLENTARRRFDSQTWEIDQLMAESQNVKCPYDIDIERKLKITLAKLRGENLDLL
jgi:aryl-alcohol dehydrogenase-like predicted oxidoreductase